MRLLTTEETESRCSELLFLSQGGSKGQRSEHAKPLLKFSAPTRAETFKTSTISCFIQCLNYPVTDEFTFICGSKEEAFFILFILLTIKV